MKDASNQQPILSKIRQDRIKKLNAIQDAKVTVIQNNKALNKVLDTKLNAWGERTSNIDLHNLLDETQVVDIDFDRGSMFDESIQEAKGKFKHKK